MIFLGQVILFLVRQLKVQGRITDMDIKTILKVDDLHPGVIHLDSVGGVLVLKNIASLDTFHLAVVGGDGGAIDDNVVVGGAANTNDFPVKSKAVGLGVLTLDCDADAGHGLGSK